VNIIVERGGQLVPRSLGAERGSQLDPQPLAAQSVGALNGGSSSIAGKLILALGQRRCE